MRIRRTPAATVALATAMVTVTPDAVSGNGWENQALFDHTGKALPGLRVLADTVTRDKGGKR